MPIGLLMLVFGPKLKKKNAAQTVVQKSAVKVQNILNPKTTKKSLKSLKWSIYFTDTHE